MIDVYSYNYKKFYDVDSKMWTVTCDEHPNLVAIDYCADIARARLVEIIIQYEDDMRRVEALWI